MDNKLGFDGHLSGTKRLGHNLPTKNARHGILGSNSQVGVDSVGLEGQQLIKRDVLNAAMVL